jgi:hypothetical protein
MPTLVGPTVQPAHIAHNHEATPWAALITAHSEARAAVGEFDLDDSGLREQVDSLVADIAGTAYTLTEALTGEPTPRPARGAPPVVRVRELATAQRRLLATLDRSVPPDDAVVDRATGHVQALSRELRCAAQSVAEPRPRSDDEQGGRRP